MPGWALTGPFEEMRVLLVEDNRDALTTLAAVLRYEQYDVVTAPDGHVALEMAKLYPPDVVLLDIGLPGMDGYQVARALRQQAPGRTLYIAAVTGYGTPADKQRAAEAGIDAPHEASPPIQRHHDLARLRVQTAERLSVACGVVLIGAVSRVSCAK